MTAPHDFEFQFGRDRALRGRGWRGLFALSLFLTALVLATGSLPYINAIPERFMHLISALKSP